MANINIFYSWQSDLPGAETRNFIQSCIDAAVKTLKDTVYVEANRDTRGNYGSPDITNVIFEKIQQCDIFVADVSIINSEHYELNENGEYVQIQKLSPNPNVLLELGYAAGVIGWENIICIANEDYGNANCIEFVSKKLANGKRIQELRMLKRMLAYARGSSKLGLFAGLSEDMKEYGKIVSQNQKENIVNVMTNEFPAGSGKKTYSQCVFIEDDGTDYKPTKTFMQMLLNDKFYEMLQELVEFGIRRYERNYKNTYKQTDLVLYQKYTYEDVCRLLNWEQNEVPLNIGGYKFDKKTKTFPVFINYDKSENISDTTKYEDHFIPGSRDRLIAISKSGRTLKSEDVQNFLKAKERGIQVELFVRKNKDDKISKEFYYLGHMTASGNTKEFTMVNTEKTAVEIEWILDVPVREDIYEYIVNS